LDDNGLRVERVRFHAGTTGRSPAYLAPGQRLVFPAGGHAVGGIHACISAQRPVAIAGSGSRQWLVRDPAASLAGEPAGWDTLLVATTVAAGVALASGAVVFKRTVKA
jgi:hypothetical protein